MAFILSDEERKAIVDLYKNGHSIVKIGERLQRAHTTVSRILKQEGVYIRKVCGKQRQVFDPAPKKENAYYDAEKIRTGIYSSDIQKVRETTNVGDILVIRTEKISNDDKHEGMNFKIGVTRNATVVNTSNKRFCLVEYENGVQEAIAWSDIVMFGRKNDGYIKS